MCQSLLSVSFAAALGISRVPLHLPRESSFARYELSCLNTAVIKAVCHAIIQLELAMKASCRPWLLAGFRKAFHMNLNAMN